MLRSVSERTLKGVGVVSQRIVFFVVSMRVVACLASRVKLVNALTALTKGMGYLRTYNISSGIMERAQMKMTFAMSHPTVEWGITAGNNYQV